MRFFILLFILILNGCYGNAISEQSAQIKKNSLKSRYSQAQDSAPKGGFPLFLKKIIPTYEPFSRYGNPQSYAVKGHTYEVLRSAAGYKARGLASWYGTKFHKQRTSSGESYNMYAMTAAHRTLPLPTFVKVKNLVNGREVVVKVNDRGPFLKNRVIDLSYAAATKLGMLPRGTVPVEVQALAVNNKPSSKSKPHIASYYVQAGAFNTQKLALTLKNKIKKVTTSPVFIEKYQKHYVVKIGPFKQKRLSDKVKKQLLAKGVQGVYALLQ